MDIFKAGIHWGCAELLNAIEKRVHPKLHVFGHVHEQNGKFLDI
jgi:Icc-related predicted phosphoesterase